MARLRMAGFPRYGPNCRSVASIGNRLFRCWPVCSDATRDAAYQTRSVFRPSAIGLCLGWRWARLAHDVLVAVKHYLAWGDSGRGHSSDLGCGQSRKLSTSDRLVMSPLGRKRTSSYWCDDCSRPVIASHCPHRNSLPRSSVEPVTRLSIRAATKDFSHERRSFRRRHHHARRPR